MYHLAVLRTLALDLLQQAMSNLRKDGHVSTVALVFDTEGLASTNLLTWKTLGEKRFIQSMFRQHLIDTKACAAIIITESWVKMRPEHPLNLAKSLQDVPGREEAIVIEARSASGGLLIIQPFEKIEGIICFKEMSTFDGSEGWSEFLDDVWKEDVNDSKFY